MTYDDLKRLAAEAYLIEKETGSPQEITVDAGIIILLLYLAAEMDKISMGEPEEAAELSFDAIEALNALDDYGVQDKIVTLH